MHPMIRSALALLGGVVAAVIVVTLSDMLVASVYELPAGTDPNDRESLKQALAVIPVSALVLLLAGWAVAAGVGSYIAARLATRANATHGLIVALFVLVATVANLVAIPHPVWMWPAAIILIPAAGWAAARLATRSTAPSSQRPVV